MFAFSGVGLGETLGAGVLLLAVRSVLSNVPAVLADARFLRADGSSFLAGRTMAVVGLAHRRMVPLHVGIIALSFLEVQWWPYGVVAIVATITFVGALWRHPTHEELAGRSREPTAGATTPPLRPPPPPPPPPGARRADRPHSTPVMRSARP